MSLLEVIENYFLFIKMKNNLDNQIVSGVGENLRVKRKFYHFFRLNCSPPIKFSIKLLLRLHIQHLQKNKMKRHNIFNHCCAMDSTPTRKINLGGLHF